MYMHLRRRLRGHLSALAQSEQVVEAASVCALAEATPCQTEQVTWQAISLR